MSDGLSARESEQFHTHGWLRLPRAFSADEAAVMRDAAWSGLAAQGIRRADPSTWRMERPQHLQHLKSNHAFGAVGSQRTIAAIDALLGGQPWKRPSDWGSFFLVFPTNR